MKEILLVLKKDLSYIARMKDILVIWEERFVLHGPDKGHFVV